MRPFRRVSMKPPPGPPGGKRTPLANGPLKAPLANGPLKQPTDFRHKKPKGTRTLEPNSGGAGPGDKKRKTAYTIVLFVFTAGYAFYMWTWGAMIDEGMVSKYRKP